MERIFKHYTSTQIQRSTREFMVTIIRWICMALFLYTAYAKSIGHNQFLAGLSIVQLIHGFATPISFLVPFFELVIALLLLHPKTATIGLYGFISAMGLFTLYIVGVLIWEKDLPCHCGGIIERLSWKQHIWFNIGFILLAIFAIQLNKLNTPFKKDQK